MRPQPPCKDCTDRTPGCHGVCLYYKDYRRKLDDQNAAFRADGKILDMFESIQHKRYLRIKKSKGGQR